MFRKVIIVRVLSVFTEILLCLKHTLTDVLLVHNAIAIVHGIGLVTRDLFRCLSWHTSSVHIPHGRPSRVMEQHPWQACLVTCSTPGSVKVLNADTSSMKHVGA